MTPSAIAMDQFRKRRAWHTRAVAERREGAADAEARLLPWLHIACLAGCDDDICFERGTTIFPWAEAGREVRIPLAEALSQAERQAALQTLARARDAAIDITISKPARAQVAAGDSPSRASPEARALTALADRLGAPPYHCPTLVTPGSTRGPALENAA